MLFLVSGAVRLHGKPTLESALRSMPRLMNRTKQLVAELRTLEAKDIKKQLHVNDALAKQYEKHLGRFEAERPVPAALLYNSPFFESLDAASLDEDDADWANSQVRIFSGLYGLLRPFDEIQPLSLPVSLSTKLTTSKGKFLRDFWKDAIGKELEDTLKKAPMPVIVKCGVADSDMEVIKQELLPEGTRIASVTFKISSQDQLLEAQGELLRWALENRCMTFEELLEFRGNIEEDDEALYRVKPGSSDEDTITFEEAVGDGNAWSKKMVESGGSRKAFIKAEASGKNRYKRTEINKSLAKDQKKLRKGQAVY